MPRDSSWLSVILTVEGRIIKRDQKLDRFLQVPPRFLIDGDRLFELMVFHGTEAVYDYRCIYGRLADAA